MTQKIVTDPKDLIPGRWYALGFKPANGGKIDWTEDRLGYGAVILKFEGDVWTDEEGEVVETIFDDETGAETTPSGADEFALQS